jgi:hypothetical protein
MSNLLASPFAVDTDKPLVALPGKRAGYLQIAPSGAVTQYRDLPESALLAAKDWAILLEKHGARRVYWITLAEMVRHLHIHLYPRWEESENKGFPLFEQRDTDPQPAWTLLLYEALQDWASRYQVHLLSPSPPIGGDRAADPVRIQS